MLVSVGSGAPTFKSALDSFDVDKSGTIRQISKDYKRDPLLSEPTEAHGWDWICKSMKLLDGAEMRPSITIADTVRDSKSSLLT